MPRDHHRHQRRDRDDVGPGQNERAEDSPRHRRHEDFEHRRHHSHDRRGPPPPFMHGFDFPEGPYAGRHPYRGPPVPPPHAFGPGGPHFHGFPEEGPHVHHHHHRGPPGGPHFHPSFDEEDPRVHYHRGPPPPAFGLPPPPPGPHFHRGFQPGLHLLGIAVLTTTIMRKGRANGLMWFGLGALVASMFLRPRIHGPPGDFGAYGARWGGRGRGKPWWKWGGGKNRGVSWKITVSETDESDREECCGERPESTRFGEKFDSAPTCNCENAESRATGGDVVFDADVEAEGEGETAEEKAKEPLASSIEHRLDSLAASIVDLRMDVSRLAGTSRSRASSVSSSGVDVGVVLNDGMPGATQST